MLAVADRNVAYLPELRRMQFFGDCPEKFGAGDGNRTHGTSLGSWGITIIRRPLLGKPQQCGKNPGPVQALASGCASGNCQVMINAAFSFAQGERHAERWPEG